MSRQRKPVIIYTDKSAFASKKFFCENCSRRLDLNRKTQELICHDCGFTVATKQAKHNALEISTIDGYTSQGKRRLHVVSETSRSQKSKKPKWEGYDDDLRSIEAKGYTIIETKEISTDKDMLSSSQS